MTPEQLRTLDREQVVFLIAHQVMHRLMQVEPDAMQLKPNGDGSVLTTTEEGRFLADLLAMLQGTVQGVTPR